MENRRMDDTHTGDKNVHSAFNFLANCGKRVNAVEGGFGFKHFDGEWKDFALRRDMGRDTWSESIVLQSRRTSTIPSSMGARAATRAAGHGAGALWSSCWRERDVDFEKAD
jgi:hypothetical protein